MTCTQWKIEAKERYEGDFQVQTKKPVLLIGNTYDGLTPLLSAHNVSSGLKGSVVLEVRGYGVCNPFNFHYGASNTKYCNGTISANLTSSTLH